MCLFRYNIEQEQKLALETTVLVEQYTVSEQEVNVVLSLLDESTILEIEFPCFESYPNLSQVFL